MSTFSLSGAGTHALTADTTGLEVTITTPSSIGGVGRSNPVAKYDQGLLRFSDGTSYWPPVAIVGGPQFVPVPQNANSMGYALLGGAEVSVTEVIGGVVFFSGGIPAIGSLSDVTLAGLADGEVLQWNAAAGKWENATLGSSSLTSSSAALGADVALTTAHTWYDGPSLVLGAGTWIVTAHATVKNAGATDVLYLRLWDGTNDFAASEAQVSVGWRESITVTARVVLAAPATIKVSANSEVGGGLLMHVLDSAGGLAHATVLTALQAS